MTGVLKEEMKELWLKQIALRRAGTPHDVAQTVLYLASPLSSYITGQVLRCDGGLQM
jgi:3-oxoacyl-[acyl-carrier protein] reductase